MKNHLQLIIRIFWVVSALAICTFGFSIWAWHHEEVAVEANQPVFCGTLSLPLTRVELIDLPGKSVFKTNCKQCHALSEVIVGPPLEHTSQLWSFPEFQQLISPTSQNRLKSNKRYREVVAKYKMDLHNNIKLGLSEDEARLVYQYLDSAACFLDQSK